MSRYAWSAARALSAGVKDAAGHMTSRMTSRMTRLVLLGALALGVSACGEEFRVPNQPAQLSEAGPAQATRFDPVSPTLVLIPYVIADEEGDDQDLLVEICAADLTQCGYPVQGAGSDGTSFVPTAVGGQPVPRRFVWDIGCGRIVAGERVAADLNASYVARVRVRGLQAPSAQAVTEAFTLAALGVQALPACARTRG